MSIFNQKGIALPLIILIVVTVVGFTAFKLVKKTPKTTPPDTQQTVVEDINSLENEAKQIETEVSQIEQTEEVFAKTLDETLKLAEQKGFKHPVIAQIPKKLMYFAGRQFEFVK